MRACGGIEVPVVGAADPRACCSIGGDYRIGVRKRNVRVTGRCIYIIAAGAKARNQKVRCYRGDRACGVAPDAREGPVVSDVAGAVTGIFIAGLIVYEWPWCCAAPIPYVACGVKIAVGRRLDTGIGVGRIGGPVANVKILIFRHRFNLEKVRIDGWANRGGVSVIGIEQVRGPIDLAQELDTR